MTETFQTVATTMPPTTAARLYLPQLLGFNVLGALLVLTWLSPAFSFWSTLDDAVFLATNAWLTEQNPAWVRLVAVTNHRLFDASSLLVLLGIYLWAISRDPVAQNRLLRWGGTGITMLLVALIMAQGVRMAIPYSHPSPTLVFDDVNLTSELVDFSTKDSSGSSFPGDHGVNLFLFTAFMWRFAGSRVMLAGLLATLLLSAPRILSGAHWFSDVYFAALAINLIIAPWFLLTPLGPLLSRAITAGLVRVRGSLHWR